MGMILQLKHMKGGWNENEKQNEALHEVLMQKMHLMEHYSQISWIHAIKERSMYEWYTVFFPFKWPHDQIYMLVRRIA